MYQTNKNPDQALFKTSPMFNNPERPFTEMLALLSTYKNHRLLHDKQDNLQALYKHITNALSSLVWGMESLGYMLALAAANNEMHYDYASGTGYFIKSIANLVEALSSSRSEVENELKHLIE